MSLLVNENRQLSGVREQAVMPAWTTDAMDADLVEFKSIQVGRLSLPVFTGQFNYNARRQQQQMQPAAA